MKILLIHNHYQQPGGEDVVVAQESALLRKAGHVVIEYCRDNTEVDTFGWWRKFTLSKRFIWASDAAEDLRRIIHARQPDIAHVHNTRFMISPAAYYACHQNGIPVVQTLHNYHALCPNAIFFRQGMVCEQCIGKTPPWPGIIHGCYRNSRIQSSMVAAILTVHRVLKTWQQQVDCFISLTEFSRQKFIKGGFPAEQIITKPNFSASDPGVGTGSKNYALFVGRLSPEKGLNILLSAWEQNNLKLPLKIVGDGPLAHMAVTASSKTQSIEFLGRQPKEKVLKFMQNAGVVIVPSTWYETFGLVIVEAFATGTPVIVSDIGAPAELVDHNRTGLHFRSGDSEDLTEKVEWLLHHPAELSRMRVAARAEYEAKYTAERNYKMLMDIYMQAIERNRNRQ